TAHRQSSICSQGMAGHRDAASIDPAAQRSRKRLIALQLIDDEVNVLGDVAPVPPIESGSKKTPQTVARHLGIRTEVLGMDGEESVTGPRLAEIAIPHPRVPQTMRKDDDRHACRG